MTWCKDFVERNEHLLFEVSTKITKRFNTAWYLIQSEGDKSRWRYKSDGDILDVRTQVELAFISGKKIDMSDRHKDLFEKYQEKYKQLNLIK